MYNTPTCFARGCSAIKSIQTIHYQVCEKRHLSSLFHGPFVDQLEFPPNVKELKLYAPDVIGALPYLPSVTKLNLEFIDDVQRLNVISGLENSYASLPSLQTLELRSYYRYHYPNLMAIAETIKRACENDTLTCLEHIRTYWEAADFAPVPYDSTGRRIEEEVRNWVRVLKKLIKAFQNYETKMNEITLNIHIPCVDIRKIADNIPEDFTRVGNLQFYNIYKHY